MHMVTNLYYLHLVLSLFEKAMCWLKLIYFFAFTNKKAYAKQAVFKQQNIGKSSYMMNKIWKIKSLVVTFTAITAN